MKEYAFTAAFFVEQQYLYIFPENLFILVLDMGVSDI